MSKSLITLAALAAISAPALAQGLYVDGGYTFISVDVEGEDVDLGALSAHVGYNFSEFVALEAEGLFGVEDEEVSAGGLTASAGLNYLVGGYVKGQIPLGEAINLYARVGLVQAEVEAEVTGPGFSGSESESDSGVGFGAGAEFFITPAVGIRGDYTRYDFDGDDVDALTAAAIFRF